jgi:hypothetical protein
MKKGVQIHHHHHHSCPFSFLFLPYPRLLFLITLFDCCAVLFCGRFGPWFCEPVVAGLTSDNKPFLSGMDLIGAPVFAEDFVVSGTCTSNLHGMCEALYRPDMVIP